MTAIVGITRTWLSIDDIVGVNDAGVTPIDVPEWHGTVGIRVITGAEREQFQRAARAQQSGQDIDLRLLLLSMTLCDQQGDRLFVGDRLATLGAKSGVVLERLCAEAIRINRLGEEAESDAGKPSTASGGTGSGSPRGSA